MKPIRVVVVDDHPMFRGGVVQILGGHSAFDVVGEGETARGQLEKSKELLAEMNLIGVVLNRSVERNDGAYY